MFTSSIILFLNLCLIIGNMYWITYENFPYRIFNILLIIFIDKNISKFILNSYNIMFDLIIINIQLFFWIGFFSIIYYFLTNYNNSH